MKDSGSPEPTQGRWWKDLGNGTLECRLCPRHCRLHEGQRGFCFVRQNQGGRLISTTYGRSTGLCVDPIEKKPLNHFLPGTSVLSFGTAGCNLGCRFCQNWQMSKAREVELLCEIATPRQIAEAAVRLGCRSVAFTYNDPVTWAEYALDTARACRQVGVRTVAVTAGYITPEAAPDFFAGMDAANVDLKAFTERFYDRLCFAHLQPVLETLLYLKNHTRVWFELTTLVIPGENDSPEELGRMFEWIAENLGVDVPLHLSAFHPAFKLLDRPPTPARTLVRARQQAMEQGLRYVYTGNIVDPEGQATRCPGCGQVVIERDWYELGAWRLKGSRCAACGQEIAGRFEGAPGRWGRQRQPVRLEGP